VLDCATVVLELAVAFATHDLTDMTASTDEPRDVVGGLCNRVGSGGGHGLVGDRLASSDRLWSFSILHLPSFGKLALIPSHLKAGDDLTQLTKEKRGNRTCQGHHVAPSANLQTTKLQDSI